jgi:hypothetical protein
MKTDWQIIRELMNSVIDSCEAMENLEITEDDRNTLYNLPRQTCGTLFKAPGLTRRVSNTR